MANLSAQTKQKFVPTEDADDIEASSVSEGKTDSRAAAPWGAWSFFGAPGGIFAQNMRNCTNVTQVTFIQTWLNAIDGAAANADEMTRAALEEAASSALPMAAWPIPEEWVGLNKMLFDRYIRQAKMLLELQKKIAESALLPVRCYVRTKQQD